MSPFVTKGKPNLDLWGNPIATAAKLDRDELARALLSYTRTMTLDDLVGCFATEFNEIIEYADLCNGGKSCKRTSLLFNPHRLDCATHKNKSIFSAFKDESFIRGLARALIWQKGSVRELFHQTIQIGINGYQYVNEFPPHVARDLAIQFNLTRGSKVLDPCAGWGGRMLGFSVVVDRYVAFEPSTRTHSGLLELERFIRQHNGTFRADVACLPFEDAAASLQEDSFDFALTSPPYFDTEHYAPGEPTNSFNRYSSFGDWALGFYAPLIHGTLRALRPGATFVINIGSRRYPLEETAFAICEGRYKIRRIKDRLARGGVGKGGHRKTEGGEAFLAITK
jgi:hypothetical protein